MDGGAGLVVGATFGYLIGRVACAETDRSRAEGAAVGGGIFAAGGLVGGGLVGLLVPRWRLRF